MLKQAGWTPDKLASWVGPEPAFKAAPQAKETNVYLQYIVSHYDRLPETIVFIHAHRCGLCAGRVAPRRCLHTEKAVGCNVTSSEEHLCKTAVEAQTLQGGLLPLGFQLPGARTKSTPKALHACHSCS